jgi:colicin import membrane protein
LYCVWSRLMSDGSVLPIVRYANPQAAADWLCTAYGFSIHHVAERPDGGTAYVVLRFGESFVLVGPHGSSAFDDLMVQPADVGNRSTQTCYLTVKDVDQHFAEALSAGARVEVEPRDDSNGGRFYMCRDPEGHLWSFGSPLVGATLAGPDCPSAHPRRYPSIGRRAVTGLAALLGLAVASSATLYLGTDVAPKALTAWIAGISGPTALAGQLQQEGATASATRRLLASEAAVVDLTEKLQISQLEFAEAQQLKQNAEKLLSASEAEYQSRLKDSQGALDTAVRAKEVASQELEAERQRAQAIQTQLDEASQQLARLRADSSKFELEARRLRTAMAQLSDALLGATQAAEAARTQIATAQSTEIELRERLRASERETTELRARVAELESDKEAARLRTVQAADAARTALAAARANQLRPPDKSRASQRGTVDAPARATAMEAGKDAVKLPPRTAPPAPKVDESMPRATPRAADVRPLPQHHSTQGNKGISVASIEKAEAERQRQAAEAARKDEEQRQRQAAEAARKAEEQRQREAAEAAQRAEAERQHQAADEAQKAEAERLAAAEAARKAEEQRQRQAAEAAQRAEAERLAAVEAARKAEEERQRQAADAAQKAEAERQRLAAAEAARIAKEAAEAKALAEQETRRRTLGLTVTPEDGARFLARGRALLTTGDVTSARLFLERASNAGLADAAMELAETYDPATVTRFNVVGLAGDREQARAWYMRAQALGSSAAAERLKSIGAQ